MDGGGSSGRTGIRTTQLQDVGEGIGVGGRPGCCTTLHPVSSIPTTSMGIVARTPGGAIQLIAHFSLADQASCAPTQRDPQLAAISIIARRSGRHGGRIKRLTARDRRTILWHEWRCAALQGDQRYGFPRASACSRRGGVSHDVMTD